MNRFFFNVFILMLLILTMGFHHLPHFLHEVLGIAIFFAVCLHLWLNKNWFKALSSGKWSSARLIPTILSFLLTISFFVGLITGVIISNHVFKALWTGVELHRNIFIHQLHVVSTYLTLIFTGMHMGFHWQALWQRIKKYPILSKIDKCPRLRIVTLTVISILGILASFLDQIGDRLMMRHIFATNATGLSQPLYYLLTLSIMGLYAVLFYYFFKWLRK